MKTYLADEKILIKKEIENVYGSIKNFAEKANLGYGRSNLQTILNPKTNCTIGTLKNVCDKLNLEIEIKRKKLFA